MGEEFSMPTVMLLRVVTAVSVLSMLAGGARADDDADSLAGPKIAAKEAEKLTIVRRDFQGKLERLEERPEIAAVRILPLDEATRAKVDAIIAERAVVVSQITLEHYDLFAKFQGAFAPGPVSAESRRERVALVRELREVAKPLFEPAFVETLAKAMPSEQATDLREMVREYREAVMASDAAERSGQAGSRDEMTMSGEGDGEAADDETSPTEGRRAARGERMRRAIDAQVYEVRLVGREMGKSFQTFIADRQQRAEELYALVDVTPEQRAKIDAIVRKDGEAAALMPTDAQRRERFAKILAVLTPEQRKKALSELGK
jgi:hypothetical protein